MEDTLFLVFEDDLTAFTVSQDSTAHYDRGTSPIQYCSADFFYRDKEFKKTAYGPVWSRMTENNHTL